MFKNDYIYIAACDTDGGIYRYKMDEEKITFVDKTSVALPMYFYVENDKFYTILRNPNGQENSGVVCFDIENDGSLCNMQDLGTTNGAAGCHLTVNNGDVYVANYISGSVSKIGKKVVSHSGVGVNLPRQNSAHCHFTGLTPDKKYILVCDLGLDTIFTYDLNLNLVSTAKVPLGYGCRHLAFSDDGKLVYCVNELVSSVTVFKYNNGELYTLDTYKAIPDDYNGPVNTAAAIRVDRGYVYVSNRGHDSIAVFKINGEKLEKAEFFSCEGEGPRDININGDYLFSTNQNTNDVTVFKIKNGRLDFINKLDAMPNPLCVVFN